MQQMCTNKVADAIVMGWWIFFENLSYVLSDREICSNLCSTAVKNCSNIDGGQRISGSLDILHNSLWDGLFTFTYLKINHRNVWRYIRILYWEKIN